MNQNKVNMHLKLRNGIDDYDGQVISISLPSKDEEAEAEAGGGGGTTNVNDNSMMSENNNNNNYNIISNGKNVTRLASILGTWTGQTHLKTDIGKYELLAYFVIHFMPDPMRGYGCSLQNCIEEHNQVCQLDKDYSAKCVDVADNVVEWSDGAYLVLCYYTVRYCLLQAASC